MQQQHEPSLTNYPHGRGYGHDYLRGGEVFGGYGYAARAEYDGSGRTEAGEAPPQETEE